MTCGWQHPTKNVIKVNSDAAIRGKNSFFGIVVRKEEGDLFENHAFKTYISDSMIAEFMAVKKVILVSLDNGWKKYHF